MIGLAELQADFQAYLLDQPNAMTEHVNDTAKADAGLLLSVYRHAYEARLIEALGEDFDALKQLVGDQAFDAIARAYLVAHPSRHASLGPFGRHFADFLAAMPPWSGRPYLAELAGFEWALRRAFDAADAAPIAVDALAGVPGEAWPGLTFRLLPSFRRLDLAWTVPQAWQAVASGADAILPPVPCDPAVAWAVWRPALTTEFRSLEPDEADALDALARGEPFAALCERLCRWVDAEAAPARAAGLLRGWIDQGMMAEAIVS